MGVQELQPHKQQEARRIARDVYNFSYIIWAFTLLITVGAFMYVIGRNTSTLEDVKQNQRIMMVYFNQQKAEAEARKKDNE